MSIDWMAVIHLAAFKRRRSFHRLWNFESFSRKICAIMSHSEHELSLKLQLWREMIFSLTTRKKKRDSLLSFSIFSFDQAPFDSTTRSDWISCLFLILPQLTCSVPLLFLFFFFLNGFKRSYTLFLSSSELILIRHTGVWGGGGAWNLWE